MTINIYINKEQNTKLNSMMQKYQVSKSTIAQWVLFYLAKYILQEEKKELIEMLNNSYVNKTGKEHKTSIKPQKDPINNGVFKNLSKAYTNALAIYLNKDVENYINRENTQEFYKELNHKLQTVQEPNYDFNRFIRSMKLYERKRA